MIKNYRALEEAEKAQAYGLLKRNITYEQFEAEMTSNLYGGGEGVLFYFVKNEIVAKVGLVLEVAHKLKTVYMHRFEVKQDLKQVKGILQAFIKEAQNLSKRYGANKLLLGTINPLVLKGAEALGLKSQYGAYRMILRDQRPQAVPLDLCPLTKANLKQYVQLYNEAFMEMPHGTYMTEEEALSYMEVASHKKHFYMVLLEGEPIGFMNSEIEGQIGCFDIGLSKAYRGKGYGKRLLETAIDYLQKQEVQEIHLIVIEKNQLAYSMYQKRGFEVMAKLSNWFEIQ